MGSRASKQQVIRIGSRGSRLAMAQSDWVHRFLKRRFPQVRFERMIITTAGDQDSSMAVFRRMPMGVFTKEIEKQLAAKKIDIAVHSLKDVPTTLPRGLKLAAFPKRENPLDVLVTKAGQNLADLRIGAKVGTGSLRRQRQLLRLRNDLKAVNIRGNVNTRIQRVMSGELDAVVIARAGLNRLGGSGHPAKTLSRHQMIPATSQGILGIEIRQRDLIVQRMVKTMNDKNTEQEAQAERSCLKALRGGCQVPVGVSAKSNGKHIKLKAGVFSVSNTKAIIENLEGPASQAGLLGVRLARILLRRGAGVLLNEARSR